MLVFVLAVLTLLRQNNPLGTSVMPSQAAFYSVSGGAMTVELRNGAGLPVAFVDSNGVSWANVTVTLPPGQAVGLGWLITQTAPDSTHVLNAMSSGQYSLVVQMGCSATTSPAGTYNSSVGAGYGIAAGLSAPNLTSPTVLVSGVAYTLSYGGGVQPLMVSGAKSAPTYVNGTTTLGNFSTGGEASNAVTTSAAALSLSGGGDPASVAYVIATNTGSVDAWVSPVSGGHTWLCPAGATTYLPTQVATLYARANGGSTTLYCIKAGF